MHTQCSPSRCTMLTGRYMHVLGHRTQTHLVQDYEMNYYRAMKEVKDLACPTYLSIDLVILYLVILYSQSADVPLNSYTIHSRPATLQREDQVLCTFSTTTHAGRISHCYVRQKRCLFRERSQPEPELLGKRHRIPEWSPGHPVPWSRRLLLSQVEAPSGCLGGETGFRFDDWKPSSQYTSSELGYERLVCQ